MKYFLITLKKTRDKRTAPNAISNYKTKINIGRGCSEEFSKQEQEEDDQSKEQEECGRKTFK